MKKTVLIICTLLISTLPAQAMNNQLFKGVTATAGAAAGVSALGWYYYNRKEASITSQLPTLNQEPNRLALERQRLYAIDAASRYKRRLVASATIGVAAGVKSGLITPKAAAITAVVAGAAERLYSYRAHRAPTAESVGLYDAAQNCKYAMLASGATALAAAGTQYVPGMISSATGMLQTAATTTKVGIGLCVAAVAVTLGVKFLPPVIDGINRIRAVASWFGV